MRPASRFPFPVLALLAAPLAAQQSLPPLPDTTGFGVHVLALARAPDNAVWVGTYGQGLFVLRQGAGSWEQVKHSSDTTGRTISFDFVHALGFGPNGEIWYGTVGNGWGLSTDGVKLSWDRGTTWSEITDSSGAVTAPHPWGRLRSQYVLALARGADGSLWASHLRGLARSTDGGRNWTEYPTPARCP